MTRKEKYPDTATFHFHNANPRNRFTTDCVARAITAATETKYEDAVMRLAGLQVLTGYAASSPEGFSKYLENLGWTKHKQPRKPDGTKYTGAEFCRALQRTDPAIAPSRCGRYVANIGGGHTVAIVDGKVWDTWDSTDGCIGNYWAK